jgi:ketosteroid isomerase-like protein
VSEENVEAIRAMYEQFARGDFSAFADFGDAFEFVTSPELPDAGTYRGEAARQWVQAWVDSFEGLTIEPTEIIDAGDKVFAGILQRGRFRGSETATEGRWWAVTTFRDGEMVRAQLFAERTHALGAAGVRD